MADDLRFEFDSVDHALGEQATSLAFARRQGVEKVRLAVSGTSRLVVVAEFIAGGGSTVYKMALPHSSVALLLLHRGMTSLGWLEGDGSSSLLMPALAQ